MTSENNEELMICGHPRSAVRGTLTQYCSECEAEARAQETVDDPVQRLVIALACLSGFLA